MKTDIATMVKFDNFFALIQYVKEILKFIMYLTQQTILRGWFCLKGISILGLILTGLLCVQSLQAQQCQPLIIKTELADGATALYGDNSTLLDTLWYDIYLFNNLSGTTVNNTSLSILNCQTGMSVDTSISVIWPCASIYVGTYHTIATPFPHDIEVQASANVLTTYGAYTFTDSKSISYLYDGIPEIGMTISNALSPSVDFGIAEPGTLFIQNESWSNYDLTNFKLELNSLIDNSVLSLDLPYLAADTLSPGESFSYDYEFYASSGEHDYQTKVTADIVGLSYPDGSALLVSASSDETVYCPAEPFTWDIEVLNDPQTINLGDTVFGVIKVYNDQSSFTMNSIYLSAEFDRVIYNSSDDWHSLNSNIVIPSSGLAAEDSLYIDFWFLPNSATSSIYINADASFIDANGLYSINSASFDTQTIDHKTFTSADVYLNIPDLDLCAGDSLYMEDGYIVNTGEVALTDIEFYIDECWTSSCNVNVLDFPNILESGDTLWLSPCAALALTVTSEFTPSIIATPLSASQQILSSQRFRLELMDMAYSMDASPEVSLLSAFINFAPDSTASIEIKFINTGCAQLNNISIGTTVYPGILEYDTLISGPYYSGDSLSLSIPTNLPPWNDPLYADSSFLADNGIVADFQTISIGGVDTAILNSFVWNVSIFGQANVYVPFIPYACIGSVPVLFLCSECPGPLCPTPPCVTPPETYEFSFELSLGTNGGGNVMPVELISFEGNKEATYNVIEWTTSSEIENDYFTLRKSQDGLSFETIITRQGKGTISTQSDYSFKDFDVKDGICYYELEQTDFDGTTAHLGILAIERRSSDISQELVLSPVPANDVLYLHSTFEMASYADIINLNGKIISKVAIENKSIDISALPSGIYFIKTETDEGMIVKKFIKE